MSMTYCTSQMKCCAPILMTQMYHQFGRTAIHLSGGGGHTETVELLLDRGVNVDTATSDHSTLFHIISVHLLPLPYCPCLSLCHVQKLVSVFCTSCLPLSFISSQSVLPLSPCGDHTLLSSAIEDACAETSQCFLHLGKREN